MPTCGTVIDLCRDFSCQLYRYGQCCNIFNEHIVICVCKSYFNMLEISARVVFIKEAAHWLYQFYY